ncbi:integrase [Granulicella aggregans]|uniref:Integrase n=1 Tax=Granulicella aggregans TaxID=474949 RepID=A0A7W7ZBL0_9BACT|nr:site-specific integrase [Granulicella aggregans]MBB5056905.1 integrase [Granulicella aggregans]
MIQRYQKGHVYKTGKRIKVWYAMFRVDLRTEDGGLKRKQRNVRLGTLSELPTKFAAQQKLTALLGETKTEVQMTLTQLSKKWTESVLPTLKHTTGNGYLKTLRTHILPAFGSAQVAAIHRSEVERFLADKAMRGYRRNTLKSMHSALSALLTWAAACSWVERNVCSGIKLPRALTPEKPVSPILQREQVEQLAGMLEEPYSTLVLFLDTTGARIGEAIGIKASDIDAEGNVHISRRIYEGKSDTPKTRKSKRVLPLGGTNLLSRLRQRGDGYLFRSREGTPVNPGNALKRYVRPAARELGITLSGWHAFRHTAATQMLRAKVSPKVVSDILGHNVGMLLSTYHHPEMEDFRLPLQDRAGGLLCNVM